MLGIDIRQYISTCIAIITIVYTLYTLCTHIVRYLFLIVSNEKKVFTYDVQKQSVQSNQNFFHTLLFLFYFCEILLDRVMYTFELGKAYLATC